MQVLERKEGEDLNGIWVFEHGNVDELMNWLYFKNKQTMPLYISVLGQTSSFSNIPLFYIFSL